MATTEVGRGGGGGVKFVLKEEKSDNNFAFGIEEAKPNISFFSTEDGRKDGNKTIFDHLKSAPLYIVDRIYGSSSSSNTSTANQQQAPWACKAVFQSLSMVSKSHVMNFSFLDTEKYPFSLDSMTKWVNVKDPIAMLEQKRALQELLALKIIVPVVDKTDNSNLQKIVNNGNQLFKLNQYFQSNLKLAISHPREPWGSEEFSITEKITVVNDKIISDMIESSRMKWNELLGILVGIYPSNHRRFSSAMEVFTERSGMMVDGVISSKGYEYLLKSYHSQVWDLVCESIKFSTNQEEALSLLFMLSYCEIGKGYSIDILTGSQRTLIVDFSLVGIIHISDTDPNVFYPTKIATNMIFGESTTDKDGDVFTESPSFVERNTLSMNSLSIIVETNLQVTAYATSELHIAMLGFFVDISLRLPNMIMGKLTREKSKKAFKMGIKAAQMIDFLVMYAHPQVRNRSSEKILPENVTDQLALWERENFRIQADEAVLIDFRNLIGFDRSLYTLLLKNVFGIERSSQQQGSKDTSVHTLDGSSRENALLWRNDESMSICVSPTSDCFDPMTAFLEKHLT